MKRRKLRRRPDLDKLVRDVIGAGPESIARALRVVTYLLEQK